MAPTTYVDYIDRSHDLLAFVLPLQQSSGVLDQSLLVDGEGGRVTTGIQKAAQKFLLLLLTIQGSVSHRPLLGCYFMQDLLQGQVRNMVDLQASFSLASATILAYLQAEELGSDPDDERLVSASIVSAAFTADGLELAIQLVSLAGTRVTYIAPLPLTV
jgi:hypothetical protein